MSNDGVVEKGPAAAKSKNPPISLVSPPFPHKFQRAVAMISFVIFLAPACLKILHACIPPSSALLSNSFTPANQTYELHMPVQQSTHPSQQLLQQSPHPSRQDVRPSHSATKHEVILCRQNAPASVQSHALKQRVPLSNSRPWPVMNPSGAESGAEMGA
jgi:hypothetical protein